MGGGKGDEKIGKYEFCSIMAVMHTREVLIRQKAQSEAIQNEINDLFCCGVECFMCSLEYGVKLCCCTCGLSCCPMYCRLQYMARQTAYRIEHADELEERLQKNIEE